MNVLLDLAEPEAGLEAVPHDGITTEINNDAPDFPLGDQGQMVIFGK